MDQLLFHPKVVHLPIALGILMPLVAGGAALAWWRGWLDRRVWVIVLLLQAALAGSGLAAMNTGETEEERIEEVVPKPYIEAHEEAAEAFVWGSAIVLALMLLPFVLPARRLRAAAAVAGCVGTLVVFGLGYRTGEAGGRLVYQHGAAQVHAVAGGVSPLPHIGEFEEEDDSGD